MYDELKIKQQQLVQYYSAHSTLNTVREYIYRVHLDRYKSTQVVNYVCVATIIK